jgi:hypothetical protein
VFLELGKNFPEALCADVIACPTLPEGQVMFDQNTLRLEFAHSGASWIKVFGSNFVAKIRMIITVALDPKQ